MRAVPGPGQEIDQPVHLRFIAEGRVEVVPAAGPFVPCDYPSDYLRANLLASAGASVIGSGAVVEGRLTRSVVWPGARVDAHEHLVDAIRLDDGATVLVRAVPDLAGC